MHGLPKMLVTLLAAIVAGLTLYGCHEETAVEGRYQPAFLPVELSVGPNGVDVRGDMAIITPIGRFGIGASYPMRRGAIYVIVRDRKRVGTCTDSDVKACPDRVFAVRTGGDDFSATVNGTVEVQYRKVIIDVTDGSIKSIKFKRAAPVPQARRAQHHAPSWWDKGVRKWDDGWRSQPYKPFMLSRFAYDDSTKDQWHGVGFAWFLVRLVAALILAVVDIVLVAVFLLAQFAYLFSGATAIIIVWVIFALVLLSFVTRLRVL
jgi:hypothetical protein